MKNRILLFALSFSLCLFGFQLAAAPSAEDGGTLQVFIDKMGGGLQIELDKDGQQIAHFDIPKEYWSPQGQFEVSLLNPKNGQVIFTAKSANGHLILPDFEGIYILELRINGYVLQNSVSF